MANLKSSKKSILVIERNRVRNRHFKSLVKSSIKKALLAISTDATSADEAVKNAQKVLDRIVSKGIMHRNTSIRKKASLMKKLHLAKKAPVIVTEENIPKKAKKAVTTKSKKSK